MCFENCIKLKLWICYICNRKILIGNIFVEVVVNKMVLEDILKELKELNSFEKYLIVIYILFMKVIVFLCGG